MRGMQFPNGRHEELRVAAVCGSEVRIYDSEGPTGRRPLIRVQQFPSYGHALAYATDFDDRQRGLVNLVSA